MNFIHEATRRLTKMENGLRVSSCDFGYGSLWRKYANALARSALRRANVVEETCLHGCSLHHARALLRCLHSGAKRQRNGRPLSGFIESARNNKEVCGQTE